MKNAGLVARCFFIGTLFKLIKKADDLKD